MCTSKRHVLFFSIIFSFLISSIGFTSPLSELTSLTGGQCGDADLSSFVNIADALQTARWSAYSGPAQGVIDTIVEATAACYNADTTHDFGVSILDALNIANFVIGRRLLNCNDITYRCAPSIYGGPFGGYQEVSFNACLALFLNPANSAPFNINNFKDTFCDPDLNCGRGEGESESPCVPVAWSSTQAVLDNVRPGYSFIGSITETGCRALSNYTEIPVGTCFHGTLGVTPLSGLNATGHPVSDKDCDTWSDAIESCIDAHIQTTNYFDQFVYTVPEFSCFYDENPGMGSFRDFIICHD